MDRPGGHCPTCGLRLYGPDALRLGQVDESLARLGHESGLLVAERKRLLEGLRRPLSPTPSGSPSPYEHPAPALVAPVVGDEPSGPGGGGEPPHLEMRPETAPRTAQNLILALGALLVALAGFAFVAVTYSHLSLAGRAVVLLAVTAAAGAASGLTLRRGMRSTAEATAGVTVALAVLDAWAARHAGLVGDVLSGAQWFAGVFAVVAVLCALHARGTGLRTTVVPAVAFAHLPLPLLIGDVTSALGPWAVTLALLAATDAGALLALHGRTGARWSIARVTLSTVALLPATGAVLAVVNGLALTGSDRVLSGLAAVVLAAALAVLGRSTGSLALRAAALVALVAAADAVLAPTASPGHQAVVLGLSTAVLAAWGVRGRGWTDEARGAAAVVAVPAWLLAAASAPGLPEWPPVLTFGALALAAALLAPGARAIVASASLAGAVVALTACALLALELPADGTALLLAVLAVVAGVVSEALAPRFRPGVVVAAVLCGVGAWGLWLTAHPPQAVEAWTVPLAALLLAGGWLQRRRHARTGSVSAYSWGLALLLTPSLAQVYGAEPDNSLLRPVLLAVASLVVLLVGFATRLQAPLVAGAGALALTALRLAAPYADDVPRWATLGLAGALLLGVGATYEARRRDVQRLRETVGRLG